MPGSPVASRSASPPLFGLIIRVIYIQIDRCVGTVYAHGPSARRYTLTNRGDDETKGEAIDNVRDAIQLYLDVLSESGDAIPEPREYDLLPA
jgi:hypothetical protein